MSLYEATPRGTRLTDAGQLLARQAALILATLDDLDQGLGKIGDGLAGTLRVAVCEEFGTCVLPRILTAFLAERPNAELRVRVASSAEVARLVEHGDAELGVAGELRRPPGVVSRPLIRDELTAVAKARAAAPDLEALTLILRPEGSSTRAVVERWLDARGVRPARVVELDSVDAIKQVVAGGLGIAFLSRMVVAAEIAHGELRALDLGAEVLPRRLDVVRSADRRPTLLGHAFEEALRGAGREPVVCSLPQAAR